MGEEDSCRCFCSKQAPAECWCDSLCSSYGDCCADYTSVCSDNPSPPPPHGEETHLAPAPAPGEECPEDEEDYGNTIVYGIFVSLIVLVIAAGLMAMAIQIMRAVTRRRTRQRQAQQAQLARMQDQIRFQGPNGLEQAGPQQYVIELAPDPHDFLPDPYTLDEADKLHDMLGEEYLCPICREVFRHPVKAADGHTYDRKCIKDWMRIKLSSPMTNERLANVDLVTDEEKESAVVEAVEKLRAQPQADRTVVDPSGDSEETDGENVEEDYPGTNPITKF
mmetsp:Transcript_4080/g.14607  ORF Transcript_4080/g.14607 Transcript_4080/m.14607 type:complete len:278 (+) Transcript_4080:150-983(+)